MTKESIDVEVRVRYAETDKMGVAYYANYFIWFEVGRAELCRIKGFSYADLEAWVTSLLSRMPNVTTGVRQGMTKRSSFALG